MPQSVTANTFFNFYAVAMSKLYFTRNVTHSAVLILAGHCVVIMTIYIKHSYIDKNVNPVSGTIIMHTNNCHFLENIYKKTISWYICTV